MPTVLPLLLDTMCSPVAELVVSADDALRSPNAPPVMLDGGRCSTLLAGNLRLMLALLEWKCVDVRSTCPGFLLMREGYHE
jgi:hypothetical protein